MDIIKFTKEKQSMYKLELDNGEELSLHEDLILKYELLLSKKIKNKEALLLENEKYLAYAIALKYLSKREITCKEMKTYLKKKEYDEELIDELIKRLVLEKALDEDRFTALYIKNKISSSNDGPFKIKNALIEKGIEEPLIYKHLSVFEKDLEIERIEKLQTKYLKTQRNKSAYIARNKLYEYLSNLGYDKSLILATIDLSDFDESAARLKEYEKQKKRLSSKYKGDELEKRIKQKLYEKGFK